MPALRKQPSAGASKHPLSPNAATTARAKRREPWLRFIALVASDFTEQELGLMSWSTVKPLVEHSGIVDPLEVALVELEWREHAAAVEAKRAEVARQDRLAAEQYEREERQREEEERKRQAEAEAAAKAAAEAEIEAAERKKLGLGSGSASARPTARRAGSPTSRVTPRVSSIPKAAPKVVPKKTAALAPPAKHVKYADEGDKAAEAKPAAMSSTRPSSSTGRVSSATAAKKPATTTTTAAAVKPATTLSPASKSRSAESKAASIIGGLTASEATSSPPARPQPATPRDKVELDLFVATPDDRADAFEAASPALVAVEDVEPLCMDDCKREFQQWCLYGNGTTDKAINFGRYMRWLKSCGLLDRHFLPRDAEVAFRSAMAQGSPARRSTSSADTNGRCPSVASAVSYATSFGGGDSQRMPYHVFRMKLLPEMAAKLRTTSQELVKKFQYCGGPKESSPKKRVQVYRQVV
jgi:hypothetical protein